MPRVSLVTAPTAPSGGHSRCTPRAVAPSSCRPRGGGRCCCFWTWSTTNPPTLGEVDGHRVRGDARTQLGGGMHDLHRLEGTVWCRNGPTAPMLQLKYLSVRVVLEHRGTL